MFSTIAMTTVTWMPDAHSATSPQVLRRRPLPTSLRFRGKACPRQGDAAPTSLVRGEKHDSGISGWRPPV
jgi:hypothetical protein